MVQVEWGYVHRLSESDNHPYGPSPGTPDRFLALTTPFRALPTLSQPRFTTKAEPVEKSSYQHDNTDQRRPLRALDLETMNQAGLHVHGSYECSLEGNVRALCEMVDSALKSSSPKSGHSPLQVKVHPFHPVGELYQSPSSPLFILSPTTFTLARNDISQVDDTVVSQLTKDTLLSLFPTPPRASSNNKPEPLSIITREPSTMAASEPKSVSDPTVTRKSLRAKKIGKNRTWVITSGLFMTPPADETLSFDDFTGRRTLNMNNDHEAVRLLSPRHPLSPCTPISPLATFKLQPGAVSPSTLAVADLCPSDSDLGSPLTSSFNHPMDMLSQHLWDMETQMRRPSFLMHGNTSTLDSLLVSNTIASAEDKHDLQERLLAELSLTIGNIVPSSEAPSFVVEPKDDNHGRISQESIPEMDWRAWHESWKRRRMKLEEAEAEMTKEPSSPPISASRTSCSSMSTTSLSSRSSSSLNQPTTSLSSRSSSSNQHSNMDIEPFSPSSTLTCLAENLKQSPPRKLFSLPSPLPTSPTSPACLTSPAHPATPTIASPPAKDANPEFWESEGLKWGDRFQMLVHSFQSTAGKHSKKWTDMLPKNRWSKRSRTRTRSSSSNVEMTRE
ncbi:MAG: hypothetical protein J3Q66DRAFT_375760 [Benniella sp.]|nr:MAG: hypothetical protein J3Q66DRAFT_375760 [Benniella sp.]